MANLQPPLSVLAPDENPAATGGKGKSPASIVVFSSLEGSLLHEGGRLVQARDAIDLLRREGVPRVLCSAKARREVELWRERIGATTADLPLRYAVDLPVIVRADGDCRQLPGRPGVRCADGKGPRGWSRAIRMALAGRSAPAGCRQIQSAALSGVA